MAYRSHGAARRLARMALLASTTLVAAPLAAQAQVAGGPEMSEKSPQGSGAIAADLMVEHQPQVVISQPGTPTTARDPVDITGVGQMVIDQRNGFLGLCTGTLINPRTVIFAAHCVNENTPQSYGTGTGQLPIGFGFKANNLPGVREWYLAGANQYRTSIANAFYNVNQVIYNPESLALGPDNNFLQADVALASLDTPAEGIPTWTILLSQLPAPGTITTASGTGYHVIEAGYGRNGTGPTGDAGGIDYRRRVAENFIGILGSLDDTDGFLFGAAGGLPQNLYQLDFDDPRRGTAASSPYDFNIFKDQALPKEGITAGGDSGGPLILDQTFSSPTVIGVLSGGSRFFNAQPGSSYGTTSFYQPLYLFWDYIVANNPYRYASARAGDGSWTDPTHWVTTLDPAYQIIAGNQLMNGVPSVTGEGVTGTSGKFGQICYQPKGGGVDECYDIGTDTYYVNGQPVALSDAQPTPATGKSSALVSAGSLADAEGSDTMTSIHEAQAGEASAATAVPIPAATLANGLPGATNFVPNNVNPDVRAGINARYYDVTLSAAGTTTLSSAVTVDRFAINGAQSRLNVTSAGSLTSLMDVTQAAGLVNIDGTLTTPGDYFLFAGGLSGTGRLNSPFFTSALGMIAPGTAGTVGTLTIGGNAILSSGNVLMIDVGANGTSDRLAVVANGTSSGMASVGGRVIFTPVAGQTVRFGDTYTILTAQGGVTGTFATPAAFSPILRPEFVYSANAVQARIAAGLYANVVANTPVQRAYAQLLDQNRTANYTNLAGLYAPLDLQNVATIQSTLEALAPRTETLKRSLGTVALDNMSRFYRDRMGQMNLTDGLGGTLAMTAQPLRLAAMAAADMPLMPGAQGTASDSPQTMLREGALPETLSAYVAGGYINGSSRPMPTAIPVGGRNDFDGWYAAAGIESELSEGAAIGFGLSYTDVKGDAAAAQTAEGELFQGTLYGKIETPAGLFADAAVSAGAFRARTKRPIAIVGTSYTLRSRDDAFAFTSEVGVGKNFDVGAIKVGPRIAGRVSHLGFTPTVETGGPAALAYYGRDFNSAQGRAGLNLSSTGRFRPFASAYYVHDFKDTPAAFGANFVGGVGPNAIFALAGQDKNWAEVSGGVAYDADAFSISVGADLTVERKDVKNQAFRGAVSFRF